MNTSMEKCIFFTFLLVQIRALRPPALASRRIAIASALIPLVSLAADQEQEGVPDRFDVDNFIRTGVVSNPMGVSGQAGVLEYEN